MWMCGLLGLILCSFGCFVTDSFICILFPEQQWQDKVDFSTTANVNPKFSLSLPLPDDNLYKHVKGWSAHRVDFHLRTKECSEFSLTGPIFHRGLDKSHRVGHVLLLFSGGHHFSCPWWPSALVLNEWAVRLLEIETNLLLRPTQIAIADER